VYARTVNSYRSQIRGRYPDVCVLRNVQNQWRRQPVPPPPASRQSPDAYDYCQSNLSFLPWRFDPASAYGETSHWVGLLWTSDEPERRDLYLTTHNTYKRQTSMPPAEFELSIPASKRPQAQTLDPAATGFDSELTISYREFRILSSVRRTAYSLKKKRTPQILVSLRFEAPVTHRAPKGSTGALRHCTETRWRCGREDMSRGGISDMPWSIHSFPFSSSF
jgi:hypothetical protein